MDAFEPITSSETSGGRRFYGRPIGIVALTALQMAHVVAVAFTIVFPAFVPDPLVQPIDPRLPFGPAALLAGLGGLVIAAGLWWTRPWAWYLAMFWVGTSMASTLVAYLYGQPAYPVMAVNVAIVFYLNQRGVRRIFHATHEREAGL